jgi:hypothetical protein
VSQCAHGSGLANGIAVSDGDLIRGEDLVFETQQDAQLIVVHMMQ